LTYKDEHLEGKQSIDNKDWLFSWLKELAEGLLLDSSVNSDSSPGWE